MSSSPRNLPWMHQLAMARRQRLPPWQDSSSRRSSSSNSRGCDSSNKAGADRQATSVVAGGGDVVAVKAGAEDIVGDGEAEEKGLLRTGRHKVHMAVAEVAALAEGGAGTMREMAQLAGSITTAELAPGITQMLHRLTTASGRSRTPAVDRQRGLAWIGSATSSALPNKAEGLQSNKTEGLRLQRRRPQRPLLQPSHKICSTSWERIDTDRLWRFADATIQTAL